jgi:hypothetical protein
MMIKISLKIMDFRPLIIILKWAGGVILPK